MTRILFLGDLAPSGFGTVTIALTKELLKLGHDIRLISQNSLEDGGPFPERTVNAQSLVATFDAIGLLASNDTTALIPSLVRGNPKLKLLDGKTWGDWKPEAAILLHDFRAAQMAVDRAEGAFGEIPSFHYIPIEGVDLPPAWAKLWKPWGPLQPVAMSRFGQQQIARITGELPPLAYHGVDVGTFHPVSKKRPIVIDPQTDKAPVVTLTTRDECKLLWAGWLGVSLPKRQWMLRTDRHMPRKRYNEMLRALVPVLAKHPDVLLLLHTVEIDFGGVLSDTISKFGLMPRADQKEDQPLIYALPARNHGQLVVTNMKGLPLPLLVSLYNAADLYVSNSAEGFGLTIAEALACGTPAVGIDFSAVPEVIGPAGAVIPPAGLVENEYDHYWAAVNESAFASRVEYLITHQAVREELGRKGPSHIAKRFRWSESAEVFASLLPKEEVAWQSSSPSPMYATT